MGSGGYRPDASQNNPANISATGGNGQSGRQGAQYIPGMRSQGVTSQEVYNQQTAAPMAGDPLGQLKVETPAQPTVIPLDAPSMYPDRPATYNNTGDLNLPTPDIMQEPDSGLAAIRIMYLRDPRNEDLRRILAAKGEASAL